MMVECDYGFGKKGSWLGKNEEKVVLTQKNRVKKKRF